MMRVLCFAAALLLVGCAPRYTWQNPDLAPGVADRQREIDSAECTAIAMQAIQMPSPPPVQPAAAPPSYSIYGTTTTYGPNGEVQTGSYSGRATAGGGFDFAGDIARAQANVDALENSNSAFVARANLTSACMLRRGWVKVQPGQQASLAPVTEVVPALQTEAAVPTPPTTLPPNSTAKPFQRFDGWKKRDGK